MDRIRAKQASSATLAETPFRAHAPAPRLRPGQAHLLRQVGRRPRPADASLSREAAELVELGYLEVTARGFLAITDAGVEALQGGRHG